MRNINISMRNRTMFLHLMGALLLLCCTTTITAQDNAGVTVACGAIFDCLSCLQNSNNCVFAVGACHDTCTEDAETGATCYSATMFSNASPMDICELYDGDNARCTSQTSCNDCVVTQKSDGRACQWYEQAGACFGGGTGPFGSGALSCGTAVPDVASATNAPTPTTIVTPATPMPTTSAPAPTTTSAPASCSSFGQCDACVQGSCAWAVGACLDDCSEISDASCYSAATFTDDMTATQICDEHRAELQDAATCAGASADCASCTSTTISDGSSCFWYPDLKACLPLECESETTCGVAECPVTTESCLAASATCETCLQASCAWFPVGLCAPTCEELAVEDADCWALGESSSVTEVCQASVDAAADRELCFAVENCSDCTTTTKSDGTTCEWYKDDATGIQWCQVGGCDANGICGSPTCDATTATTTTPVAAPTTSTPATTEPPAVDTPATTTDAAPVAVDQDMTTTEGSMQNVTYDNNSTNAPIIFYECLDYDSYGADGCEPCLNSPLGCVWVLQSCVSSCDAIADATCFAPENFPNSTTTDICAAANVNQDDVALCGSKNYCFTCTSTEKSDGTMCSWYIDGDDEWCDIGGCTVDGVCGESDELICHVETEDPEPGPPNGDFNQQEQEDGISRGVRLSIGVGVVLVVGVAVMFGSSMMV